MPNTLFTAWDMKEPITIRAYEKGDEREIVELMNLVYASEERKKSLGHWKWKYRNTPSNLVAIAEANGQIVGHMALIPLKMKVMKRIVTCGQAVDLVVHPEFRRRGLFLTLAKALVRQSKENGIPLWYGFPTPPAYSGHLKYGWFDVCDLRVSRGLLSARSVLSQKNGRLATLSPVMKPFSRLLEISLSMYSKITQPRSVDVEIEQCRFFDERIDQFWLEVSGRFETMVVRSKDYLNWRFREVEGRNYSVFIQEKDGIIAGYAVVTIRKNNETRIGYIVDILAKHNDVFENLIRFSIEHFHQQDVDMVEFWSPPALTDLGYLRRIGFLPYPAKRKKLIARINLPYLSQDVLSRHTRWYITMGDSDMI